MGQTNENHIGPNQYLFYEVNDAVTVGTRFEWWKSDVITGYAPHGVTLPSSGSVSHYGATFGANWMISKNLMLRPEFRYDWSEGADYEQGILGMDLVATF